MSDDTALIDAPEEVDTENAEGGAEENDAESTRNRKPPYIESANADLLNDDGKIVKSPIDDFNPEMTCAPRKADFADELDYLTFRAQRARADAQVLIAEAESLEKQVKTLSELGDSKQRERVRKIARLRAMLAKEEAGADEMGLDINEILNSVG